MIRTWQKIPEYSLMQRNAASVRRPQSATLTFGPWTGGLVTAKEAERCDLRECSELLNMVLTDGGYARTRNGISQICTGASGRVVSAGDFRINGEYMTLFGTVEEGAESIFRLYKANTDGTVTQIGDNDSLEGRPYLIGFNDLLIICDQSYIKFWDGGSDIQMAYDDGLGANAYHFNNRWGQNDPAPVDLLPQALGNGTVQRVAYRFTTGTWTAKYTIPPSVCYATLCKKGEGYVGDKQRMWIRIRNVSDVVIAEKEILYPDTLKQDTSPSHDGTYEINYLEYEFVMSEADMIPPYTGLAQTTTYYMSLEYSGGDADNHVWVQCCRITYWGWLHTGGSGWTQMTLKTPLFGMRTSRPPKASYGIVHASRLFCIEGTEGANPSYLWYSGVMNHLDWSSPDTGGYLDCGKPVGAIASYYDQVWLFGTANEPSLSRLAGTKPSEYSLTDTMQKVSAHQPSVTVTPDDIYFLHPGGVSAIGTMTEFGDVRTVSQGENIKDLISSYYSLKAFCGYEPEYGLTLLKLDDGTDYIYVLHNRQKNIKYFGQQPYLYSPAARWKFRLPVSGGVSQQVSCFGYGQNALYIGTTGGQIWKVEKGNLTDGGTYPEYQLKTAYHSTKMGEMAVQKLYLDVFGKTGGRFSVKGYKNHSLQPFQTWNMYLPTELAVEHPPAPASFICNFDRINANFNFRSLLLSYEDIIPAATNCPIYFGAMQLLCMRIGGL